MKSAIDKETVDLEQLRQEVEQKVMAQFQTDDYQQRLSEKKQKITEDQSKIYGKIQTLADDLKNLKNLLSQFDENETEEGEDEDAFDLTDFLLKYKTQQEVNRKYFQIALANHMGKKKTNIEPQVDKSAVKLSIAEMAKRQDEYM